MKTLFAAFFLLTAFVSASQQELRDLDPVTVTASLEPRPLSKTGRNLVVFRGESFNNLPVHSVDDLLRYLPGMEVQMRGPMGSQSDIVLRGGTFQQVLVLLDGVRLNDPNTGHFSSYIPISPAEIERVEILKGASSAIYGAEAVGGVVHIITRTFAARRNIPSLYVNGNLSAGEYDLTSINAGAFYQHGNTALGGGLLSNNTSGRLQRGMRGFAHNNTATVSATQFINSKWQVSGRVAYDNRDFGAQNFYTPFASDSATEKVRTIWSQVAVSYQGTSHRIYLDAGYKHVLDEYAYNKVSIANENKSSLWQMTVRDEWKWNSKLSFVSGVQFIDKGIRSNDRGNHHVQQGGLFFLLNYSPIEKLTLLPAARIEYNERSGVEVIPQLNLSYREGSFQFRGSAGKTIRDADFTERFNNYNKPIVSAGGRIGDPGLEAERSFSYEAGVDYFPGKAWRISTTYFQRHHRRLIDYVITPYDQMPRKDNLVPNASYALARNIAKVDTRGAELDVQYQHQFGKASKLYAAMGIVWLESKSSDATPSFYVASHAKWLTNAFAEWQGNRFLFSISGLYKRRSPQAAAAINASLGKDYFLLNAKAGVFFLQKRLNVFTRVDNVFDTEYADLLGAIMPGRWWSSGVNFRFAR